MPEQSVNYFEPTYGPHGEDLRIGMAVRFTGGKYNGWEGHIHLAGDTSCAVLCNYEGKDYEFVEDFQFLTPLKIWTENKSKAELQLKGH